MTLILGVLEEGLIYAVMALGVYITYKILDFPDLSVDSTFPMGAALTASALLAGMDPVLTLILSFAAGAAAGCVTGLIHVKLKVRDLLSGIIVMTGLYSVNLRLAGGRANVPVFNQDTIFENPFLADVIPALLSPYLMVLILFLIILICKVLLDLYLNTRSGYLLRAVGDNEALVTSLAKDKGMVKILGLAIANGFSALAGSIYCQHKGFFEISVGTGTIVIGLASVIIGIQLLCPENGVSLPSRLGLPQVRPTTAVIAGSVVYKACISLAISMGMEANDLKLITSILFLIILVVSTERRKKVKGLA
ncbi:MAG: ABC transporter permease [Hungatella sp.]|nr:ABC transporter permease [Hungatella sp.]